MQIDNQSKLSNAINFPDSAAVIDCRVSELCESRLSALVDTGSQVSLIRSSLLPLHLRANVNSKNLTLRTVNEQMLSVNESISLCVEVQGVSYNQEFIIFDNLIYPVILGFDFISKNSIKLEFSPPTVQNDKCACSVELERSDQIDNEDEFCLTSFEPEKYCLPEVNDPELHRLIEEYKDIFRVRPGRTNLCKYDIRLVDDVPIRIPPRRSPVHLSDQIQNILQQLLDYGVIEPSRSPYVFPAVFVPKKSGGLRMTVDYRALNKKTISPATVLPHLDQVKEKLAGHSVFSVLDLNSGFFQIPLNPNDREKTAFCPGPGFPIYQFTVMPQGISGGPSACTELMNRVYKGLSFTFNFMDDSMIVSKSRKEHLCHLRQCFERVRLAGLTLNGAKCQIARPEVQFLGTVFSKDGAAPSSSKVSAIQSIKSLNTVKEVRQFLGLASQYRKYIHHFADISEPLNRLLDKDAEFIWSTRCQDALEELKARLSSAPVLANPDITKPFEVFTDASDIAVAAVLQQEGKPIEYASRALTVAERKYSVSEKECLAILYALKTFRHYLLGQHFTLFTDHCPLTFLQNQRNDSHGRLGRWSLMLQNYDFTIKYVKGTSNVSADALSRLHGLASVCVTSSQSISEKQLREAQSSDVNLLAVMTALRNDCFPQDQRWKKPPLNHYRRIRNKLLLDDCDVLCRRFNDIAGERCVPVIPLPLRETIIKDCHVGSGCHLGPEKLYHTLQLSCYWPGMSDDVIDFCSSCTTCQKSKPHGPKKVPLGSMPIGKPWEFVATDILKVPVSTKGRQYILVFQDYFTKFLYAVPIADQSAATITDEFKQLCSVFGAPSVIHSDQGGCFESKLFGETLEVLGVRKSHTSAYNPKCNGMVERSNRSILQLLRCLCSEVSDWEEKLPFAVMAFNSHVHTSTGMTPSRLMFARDLSVKPPISSSSCAKYYDITTYVKKLEADYVRAHEIVHQRLEAMAQDAKNYYDRTTAQRQSLQPGEEVLLRNETRRSKLDPFWIGGWKVVKNDGMLVTIERPGMRNTRRIVNINRVKSANSRVSDLKRDDSDEPTPRIFHEFEDACDSNSATANAEQTDVRRYPIRNRKPPDRLNYYEF